jgi:hypothetical protein
MIRKPVSFLSVLLMSAGMLFLASTSANAHDIICRFQPNYPGKSGTRVTFSAEVFCNYEPDVSVSSIRLWRHDGGGAYTLMAEISTSNTATYRYNSGTIGCGTTLSRQYHTQIYNESFHHNWGVTDKSGGAVWLTCQE